jgi:hypothetical protein
MVWESGVKRHKKTIAAIEAAMGKPPPEAKAAVMAVRRGQRFPLCAAARITLEDGAVLCAHDALPGDCPPVITCCDTLMKIAPPS